MTKNAFTKCKHRSENKGYFHRVFHVFRVSLKLFPEKKFYSYLIEAIQLACGENDFRVQFSRTKTWKKIILEQTATQSQASPPAILRYSQSDWVSMTIHN